MPGIFIPEFDTKFPDDFVLDDFLQPLENSRAAREFSGNSGQYLVLEFRYRYSTGIPYDFELFLILILALILNCSTVVLNYHKSLEDLLLRSVTQGGNTSGSGHWIKNSGSSDETRRNSRSFPYMYESSSLSELETFCSSPHCIVCM